MHKEFHKGGLAEAIIKKLSFRNLARNSEILFLQTLNFLREVVFSNEGVVMLMVLENWSDMLQFRPDIGTAMSQC